MLYPLPEGLADPKIGQLVHEQMGITKYEPPAEQLMSKGRCEAAPRHFIFPEYTDIEGLRKWKSTFESHPTARREVIITEKIHGCFVSGTKVTMIDGSKKRISALSVGDIVLGVDEMGNITPSTVLKTWVKDNETFKPWVKVRLTRKKVKAGNSYCALTCTSDHQIAVKTEKGIEWKEAGQLRIDDTVLIHRSDLSIPELQKQILLGMLLGGASTGGEGFSWSVEWSHSQKDEGYVDWIERALGDVFFRGSRHKRTSGFGGSISLTGRTIWSNDIRNSFADFFDDNGKNKRIPDRIVDLITPLALAFWYMDDGSLGYGDGEDQDNTASFATCSFSIEDCQKLVRALAKFGIASSISNYDYPRIKLNAAAAEKLFILVAPYIPPAMQRKLPPRYRGGPGWLPPVTAPQRYTQLVEQKVILVTDVEARSRLWDITTSTGNFFAHETLVHNSNARFCHDGQRLWVGSRTQIKAEDPKTWWWRVAANMDLANKLSKFPLTVFYGEVFGKGVQDLNYGTDITFRIFDTLDGKHGTYHDWDHTCELAAAVGLDTVTPLYRGPWGGFDAHKHLAEGKSTIGGDHVREGFVVKPTTECWDPQLGRVILKLIGEGYDLR
jgi:hypothetical protein